jgi:hypothetical protein
VHPECRVDVFASDCVRILCGDFLDIDAAAGRDHRDRPADAAVHRDADVEFVDEVDGLFDEHPIDVIAFEIHSQDLLGCLASLCFVLDEFDTASFPAPADVYLCLDRDWIADFGGCFDGGVDVPCEPCIGCRNPGVGKHLFGLIFVESHFGSAGNLQ